MIYKVEGIELDKPNKNGRIYSKELIENAIINSELVKEQLNNKCLFIEFGDNEHLEVDISKVCAIVKGIRIVDDSIVSVDVDFINTPLGKVAKTLQDKLKVIAVGKGNIKPIDDNTEEVIDYKFCKFYLDM